MTLEELERLIADDEGGAVERSLSMRIDFALRGMGGVPFGSWEQTK